MSSSGTGCPPTNQDGAESTPSAQQPDEKDRILGDTSDDNDTAMTKTGIVMTAANMATNIIGSGMIAYPYAFKETGFAFGIGLLCLVAFISGYTLLLIVRAGQQCKKFSYQEVGQAAFGAPGALLVGFLQICVAVSCSVTYNMFIADNVTKLLMRLLGVLNVDEIHSHFWGSRWFIIGLHTLLFAIPSVSAKSVANISKLGAVSVFSVILSIILFCARYTSYHLPLAENAYRITSPDAMAGIGILAFGFMTHESSFVLYNSLSSPSDQRWRATVTLAVSACCGMVLVVGVVGYLTFNEYVQANLFQNYCSTDDVINAARTIFVVAMIARFAIGLFCAREVLEFTFFSKSRDSYVRHVCLGVFLCVLSYCLSLITSCLGIVLEFVGVFAITPLIFILPPLFLLQLQPDRVLCPSNVPLLLVLALGVAVCVLGLANLCIRVASGQASCNLGEEPFYCLQKEPTS